MFALVTGAGNITLNVSPAALGANLDVRADLLDAAGNVIASSNPEGALAASLSLNLPAGTYYLRIDGAGVGNPSANPPTGYSDYGSIGQYTINGLIVDAGSLATLAVSDVSVSEAAGLAVFTVTLSGTIHDPVSFDYLTSDDTAGAGGDYGATQGTHTFLPGGPNQFQVTVPIIGDTTYESVERFFLRLANASAGAMIADGQGVATITDDDVALSISNWSTREGSPNRGKRSSGVQLTPFTFTISLSGPASTAVMVRYDTQDGTAIAGSDYNQAGGTITFAPGETTKTVTVNVIADSSVEPDEAFSVVLSSPVGAELADTTGEGTILDDDTRTGGKPPKVSAAQTDNAPEAEALQPVRDFFAWQDGAAHYHDHDHESSDLDSGRRALPVAAIVLADRSDELPSPTPITSSSQHVRRDEDSWRLNIRQQSIVASRPDSTANPLSSDNPMGDASGDRVAPGDDDWLELLAHDQETLAAW